MSLPGVATAQAEPLDADAQALSTVLAGHAELSKWTPTTPSAFHSEGHELAQVRGYLNELAAKRVGSEPFAEGSALALVEESDGRVGRAFYMLKMPAGYDEAGHDWFYAELDASGKALWSGSSAQQQIDRRCASCHRLGAKGSDLVYGPP
ncbi:MAG: hypothetical protein RBU37_10370 [Myxococcota bacterium]|jgi:hypothetical protein|nr:hypothetical protein [Myxococcota bacterium]